MTLSGWIVADKPVGITSAQLVGMVKRKLRLVTGTKVKIGHTGTLDPFATGILPLAIGEATKLSQIFLDASKSYEFTLAWGAQTDTADIEGNIIAEHEFMPDIKMITDVIPKFLGSQLQTPPKYSALKVDGKRAYELARKNIDFTLKQREIHIFDLSLLSHDPINKKTCFSVTCSKGTYVRTLGQDIAVACGSVGHLNRLHRTKVGFFSSNHAIFPDICEKILYKNILDISEPLSGISAISVDNIQAQALRFGQTVLWSDQVPDNIIFPAMENGKLVALASYRDDDHSIYPRRVFNL